MSSLNLSPVIAELAFEKMLSSYAILGVDDKSSEDGSGIVGINLKVLGAGWQGHPKCLGVV